MQNLKDNNAEVSKIFSKVTLVIQPTMIKMDRCYTIHLIIKHVIMRSTKSNWVQIPGIGFKETQRWIWIVPCPLA